MPFTTAPYQTRRIYKTSPVRVLALYGNLFGFDTTIQSLSHKNQNATILDLDGRPHTFPLDTLMHLEDKNIAEVTEMAKVAQAEHNTELLGERSRRQRETEYNYIASRATVLPEEREYVRIERQYDIQYHQHKVSSRDNQAYTSEMISISQNLREDGTPMGRFGGTAPNVTVNWSSIGSSSPEIALAFARSLITAATEAMKLRAVQEDTAGLTDLIAEARIRQSMTEILSDTQEPTSEDMAEAEADAGWNGMSERVTLEPTSEAQA